MVTKPLLILLPIFLPYVYVLEFSKQVQIAGLFDQDEAIQNMFRLSMKTVNQDRRWNEEFLNVSLISDIQEIEGDSFDAAEKVCEQLDLGIVGVFGPQEKVVANHLQSICDAIEVPYISVRQDFDQLSQPRGLSLNLYPYISSLARLYNQLVTEFKWKSFAILYENTDSLIRMHLILKRWTTQGNAFIYHLGSGPNYRQGMREIKASKIENIIIDCSSEILEEVLKQAQQVGILSEKYKVIVTSLDLQTLDLEPYQYSGVNLTGVRLINPEDPLVIQTFKRHSNELGLDNPSQLRVEPALMYDAVQLFARAFKQLKDAAEGDVKQLPCDASDRWEHGLSLSNFMRSTEMKGLTGLVKFDRDGFRNNIELDIIRLTENGLIKIGEWNSTAVLISLTPPHAMEKESIARLTGNERYEGFAIDIIDEISKILKFNYTLEVESDYGSVIESTGKWTGMLGRIMVDEADLAITDLTITSARQAVVDFTNPIMNLGISILYKKPSKEAPSLFSFLSPFSNTVWSWLIGAYIVVSLLLYIIGRICPAEWNNPYPCIEEPEELENQFTFKNAFWFAIGSIMQQGSEIAPIGISTRMVASCWWFFCLIMVSSYTANLAAFLTVETLTSPFNNVEELATKTTIKYGAKDGGATLNFFKNNSYPIYHQMYETMMANRKEVLVVDNTAGLQRAIKDKDYAFLMESASIEYEIERHCEVTQIGGLLDEKGYGIAMKKNSPRLHSINSAVLKLSEGGLIQEIKKKWWTQKRGGGKCRENGGAGSADPLDFDNVGGVFLVLTIGVVLSCVYTICELLWDVARTSIRENVSFKEELINELKFIAKCSGSKPVRRKNGLSSKNDSTGNCTPPYGFVPTVIRTSPNDDKSQ